MQRVRTITRWILLTAILAVTFGCAAHYGAERLAVEELSHKRELYSPMTCNQALSAGFRIYDPDGFEVERFDDDDYWTTEPKPCSSN
jgi:hypothetical protein